MYKLENKKILFYGNINFNLLEHLGFGSQGDVYKFKIKGKNFALKVFNGIQTPDLKSYEEKLGISINSYITPLKLMYINDVFSGYLMKFCNGNNLVDKKLNLTVDSFVKNYKILLKDTEKLSKLKYIISDLAAVNAMYDGGIKIIDIDDYSRDTSKSFDEINYLNTKIINDFLFELLDVYRVFNVNDDMRQILVKCNEGKIDFNELFNRVYDMACNISNTKITNINQIRKTLNKPFYNR